IHDKHFGELQPPEQSEHVWHHVLSGSTVDKPESLVYDDRDHGAKSDTESELEKMKNNK
ncbi:MAG: hypothetical protein HYT13_02025, partial [Candidatus Liptonbacteria bacterium]|nr:hypothetical protein [Candidatus Liptonbacteria bacterium]